MSSSLIDKLRDRKVDSRLLEGEWIIEVVVKHWVVYFKAWCLMLLALPLWALAAVSHRQALSVPLVLAGFAAVIGGMMMVLEQYRDVFVITNMRVFRLSGLFNRTTATMPINRILDFTVHQPFAGRLLGVGDARRGYGHLVFETAAQSQGLREIKYISDPAGRDRTIQQVVQDAGLRGNVEGSGM